ncbi:MAG: peptidoglycan D,D-transpeptidase FtsI family protein [Acidimicrobiales bacterium]
MNRRIMGLGIALMVCFAALFLQLNYIQVVEASKLANAPGNSRNLTADYSKPRGFIQTSDGVVVARSVPSKDDLKYQRQYPTGGLFAGITGYDSFIYGVGGGVEATYNNVLTGKNLPLRSIKQLFSNTNVVGNVTLTLSNKLQTTAANALAGKTGAVIAMDPTTGAILAMYANPTYDPSPLASHNANDERNAWGLYTLNPSNPMLPRSYRQTYPPGSTYKIVVSSAVFDHDPALAQKQYPTVSSISLPQTTNKLHNYNYETCGGLLPQLLQVSCDTGFGQVGLDLGASNMSEEASAFGFNQYPPIDLPGVAASTFPAASFFSQQEPLLAYAAIGQDVVTATPLQMALVGETIADGGTMMTPHVMARVTDQQGNVLESYNPKAWLHPTSAATAAQVTSMMELVTQGNGTAADVVIPGVKVAAKTGTAQTGHHSTDDWMVAFAPANAPRIVVAVAVPNQVTSATGDSVAGPITLAVLKAALGGS